MRTQRDSAGPQLRQQLLYSLASNGAAWTADRVHRAVSDTKEQLVEDWAARRGAHCLHIAIADSVLEQRVFLSSLYSRVLRSSLQIPSFMLRFAIASMLASIDHLVY